MVVYRQHDSDITTRRMAGQKEFFWVAAIFGDMMMHPGYCIGAIFQKRRKVYLRIEAIIGDDSDKPLRGKSLGSEFVIILASHLPAAAIEKHDHAFGSIGLIGDINIKSLARIKAIGDILMHV